jgi:nucleotide-binding universal stress UspA family protein
MYSTMLVPFDGSRLAARAVPYAVFLTRAVHGDLVLFHAASDRAIGRDPGADIETILEQERLVDQLIQDGIPTTAHIVRGDAGPTMVQAVVNLGADLVVMSTHGRGGVGRLVHGSVADYLLRHAPVPVLLITADCDRDWVSDRPMRIVIPLDGSALAETAVEPALELARSFPVEICLLGAAQERIGIDVLGFARREPASAADLEVARQHVDQAAARIRRSGPRVSVVVEAGEAADVISRVAARDEIDLVVMATHGQGGFGRLVLEGMATVVTAGRVPLHLGSVAAACLRRLVVPVLLVSPTTVGKSVPPAAPPVPP